MSHEEMSEIPGIVIRAYDSKDYPTVRKILEEARLYYDPVDSQERVDEKVFLDPRSVFVATDPSGVVGTVSIMEDGRMAFIFRLAVAQTHRGKGLGLELMRRAERELKGRGHKEVHILVEEDNLELRNYYLGQGFEEGHSYRWMTKPLE